MLTTPVSLGHSVAGAEGRRLVGGEAVRQLRFLLVREGNVALRDEHRRMPTLLLEELQRSAFGMGERDVGVPQPVRSEAVQSDPLCPVPHRRQKLRLQV